MGFRRRRQGFHEQGMRNVSKHSKRHGKNSNVRSSKAEDQKDPRKEQVNGGGERRGRRSEGGKWTTICGKRKPSKS